MWTSEHLSKFINAILSTKNISHLSQQHISVVHMICDTLGVRKWGLQCVLLLESNSTIPGSIKLERATVYCGALIAKYGSIREIVAHCEEYSLQLHIVIL